ncbi:4-(cytidine 5'-diphospho)-2-C-methyl-D-erythritol kinase [Planctomycetota bacterium]
MLDKSRAMDRQSGMWLRPPAKINLSLVVRGRRSDGFHDLHTIMATIGLHDDLNLDRSPSVGIELRCTGRPCPGERENLVYQAAELLADYSNMSPALRIRLHKRIPAGAGLGGASSDAAACLLGLNRLWDLHLSREQLCDLAAQLGSDVPFFLYGPVALCSGRGEVVKRLPQRCSRSILLILPEISMPTAEVYQGYHYDEQSCQDYMRRVNYFLRAGDLDGLVIQRINSLEDSCMELSEPLGELRRNIESLGIGPLQISGSGSCLFATYGSQEEAVRWADIIQEHKVAQVQVLNFFDQAEPFLEVHHADF